MPKMKSHRGSAKRFRVTSTGKIRRRRANANHKLGKKTSRRKRHLTASDATVAKADEQRIRRMLGR
jgi:large subunit ribosomal protein L35